MISAMPGPFRTPAHLRAAGSPVCHSRQVAGGKFAKIEWGRSGQPQCPRQERPGRIVGRRRNVAALSLPARRSSGVAVSAGHARAGKQDHLWRGTREDGIRQRGLARAKQVKDAERNKGDSAREPPNQIHRVLRPVVRALA